MLVGEKINNEVLEIANKMLMRDNVNILENTQKI